MGLDLNALWANAEQSIHQGMNDLLQTGGNAALGYAEQQAINIIEADKKDKQAAFQTATSTILSRPTAADSFGAYVSGLSKNPILKTYGTPVMLGVAAVALVAIFLVRR